MRELYSLGRGGAHVLDLRLPCRMLAPVMDEVAPEFADKAEFVKIDIDQDREIAISYGISSIPNVLILRGSEVVASNLGFVPAEILREFFKENL